MRNLAGKRLLLLGGNMWAPTLLKISQEMGIELLATGNKPNAQINDIAQEVFSVNSTDVAQMETLLNSNNIDGVYVGADEIVIVAACQYLTSQGYPTYYSIEKWNSLHDKRNFKRLCGEFGLPVVRDYDVFELSRIEYPVIVKPVDGSGSRGMSLAHSADQIQPAIDKALAASASGQLLIEQYVNNDALVVFYTFRNGVPIFCGLQDKYPVFYEKHGTFLSGLHIFNSDKTSEFRRLFEPQLFKLFSNLNIMNGNVWIEIFYDGKNYYFNEVGFRYFGSVSPFPINLYYGINQIASDIYFALTGEVAEQEYSPLIEVEHKKHYYCSYPIHLHPGTISHISGIDELLASGAAIVVPASKRVGDTISDTGTLSQFFGYVHFMFDTFAELKLAIGQIHQHLKVLDNNGENMVRRVMDVSRAKPRLNNYLQEANHEIS